MAIKYTKWPYYISNDQKCTYILNFKAHQNLLTLGFFVMKMYHMATLPPSLDWVAVKNTPESSFLKITCPTRLNVIRMP
jgi:hypothetical protein